LKYILTFPQITAVSPNDLELSHCPGGATRTGFAAVATVEDREVVECHLQMAPFVLSGGY